MNNLRPNTQNVHGYKFGPFVVDLSAYALRREHDIVSITPKAFDTLVVLLRNRNRVVSKDELMNELWPGAFVSEDSLTQSVSVLRRALGDDSTQPHYIATAARHGYRFIAPVEELANEPELDPAAELPPSVKSAASPAAPAGTSQHDVGARRPLWSALALPATFVAILVSFLVIRNQSVTPVSRPERGPLRFTQDAPAGTTLLSGGALSPDGRFVAFVAQDNRSSASQLWIRPLEAPEPRALPGTDGATRPFWSPDSRHLGFFANGKLRTVGLDGQPPRAIASTDSTTEGGGSWGSNDLILFTVLRSGLYSVPAAGGEVTEVTTLKPTEQEIAHRWPQFLPDGRRFLFFIDSVRAERAGTYLGSLDSPERTRLLDAQAVYAPPGHLVYIRDRSLTAQPIDLARGRLVGTPTTLAGSAISATTTNGAVISATDGLLSFGVSTSAERLEWFSRTGQRMGSVDATTTLRNPAISPDGRQLLAASNADPEHKGLWVIELDRGAQTRIASDGMRPFWSPDGTEIVFTSDRAAGIADLYRRSITGRDGEEQALLKSSENKFICDWSPDGRYLVYDSINPSTKSDLWLLPLDGEGRTPVPYLVTPNNEVAAQVSPDGRWAAYASDESGKWEVYVQSFPAGGSKQIISAGGGIEPHWRRDGRELFYLGSDRSLVAVPVTFEGASLRTGKPQKLFRASVPNLNVFIDWYAASPDGQRFVLNTGGSGAVQPITLLANWSARLTP